MQENEEKLSELELAQAALDDCDLSCAIEAVLIASGEPVSIEKLVEIFVKDQEVVQAAIEKLKVRYQANDFGFELKPVNSGFQIRTKSHFAAFIKALSESKPKRLTGAALETLAVIAYRQPVVKSDIETIRGVDATPTIKTLMDRKLIKVIGYQNSVGQPALYGTTENFLKIFGLNTLTDLPSLRELQEIEADPGETSEQYSNEYVNELEGA